METELGHKLVIYISRTLSSTEQGERMLEKVELQNKLKSLKVSLGEVGCCHQQQKRRKKYRTKVLS